jgi:hypothetical protein
MLCYTYVSCLFVICIHTKYHILLYSISKKGSLDFVWSPYYHILFYKNCNLKNCVCFLIVELILKLNINSYFIILHSWHAGVIDSRKLKCTVFPSTLILYVYLSSQLLYVSSLTWSCHLIFALCCDYFLYVFLYDILRAILFPCMHNRSEVLYS